VGRHARATARRAGATSGAALALVLVLQGVAGAPLGALALTVAMLVVWLAACRLLAAGRRDADEERWLRHVLGGLRPHPVEEQDEDPDAFVL
jgi:hypothetical protein